MVQVERLHHKIRRSFLHRPHRQRHIRMSGHHDHRGLPSLLPHPVQQLDAVHAPEVDIQQHDIRFLVIQELEELLPAVAEGHRVSEFTQDLLQCVPEDRFVISHQYPRFRHGEFLFLAVSW